MCAEKFSFRMLFTNSFEGFRILNQVWMPLLREKATQVAAKFDARTLHQGIVPSAFQSINLKALPPVRIIQVQVTPPVPARYCLGGDQ
jgi:hypothetical protein